MQGHTGQGWTNIAPLSKGKYKIQSCLPPPPLHLVTDTITKEVARGDILRSPRIDS
jgi:hypothetical protein